MAFAIDKNKILKNTATMYVRMAITMVIAFFTTRVTLEQLGIDDFGLNNLVGSIVSMFSFLNGSMGTAVQRFFSIEIGKENCQRLKKIYGVGLSLHIIVAVVSVVGAEIFALLFLGKMNIPENRMLAAHVVFQISIASFALHIVNVPNAALLRAREWFSKTAKIEVIQSVLRLGVLYLLVYIGKDKLITLSILNLFVTAYYVFSFWYLARKFSESHTFPLIDKNLIKDMLSFISFLILTVFAQLLNTQGLIMLVNLFFGLAINAAYAVAVQVSNLVNTFVLNFKSAMVPQLMASYGANDKNSMFKLMNVGTKATFLLMLLISCPLIFDGSLLLSIWLKNPPLYSEKLVALTTININISSFTYFLYQAVHATGKIRGQQLWMSSLFITNIFVVWLCFKLGGNFYSALYVNMLVSILQCIVNLVYAKKHLAFSVKKFAVKVVLPCLMLVLFALIVFYCRNLLNVNVVLSCIMDVLADVLVVVIGVFAVFDKQERSGLIQMLSNKLLKGKKVGA